MEELFFNSWVEWYKWIKKERKETNHFNQKTPCNQDCFPFLCAGKEIKPVNPKGNQPWIFIGRTDDETEAPILWPCEVWTHWTRPWCWERLRAGLERGNRGLGWLDSITDSMDMNLSKVFEVVEDRGTWCSAVHGVTKSWKWLRDWITATYAHNTSR